MPHILRIDDIVARECEIPCHDGVSHWQGRGCADRREASRQRQKCSRTSEVCGADERKHTNTRTIGTTNLQAPVWRTEITLLYAYLAVYHIYMDPLSIHLNRVVNRLCDFWFGGQPPFAPSHANAAKSHGAMVVRLRRILVLVVTIHSGERSLSSKRGWATAFCTCSLGNMASPVCVFCDGGVLSTCAERSEQSGCYK